MACVVKAQRKGGVIVRPFDVYIGRAMYQGGWQLPKSKWANPFKIGSPNIPNAEAAVIAYWTWLHADEQKTLLGQVSELKGLVLGCWCKAKGHEPCHGDVLLYKANGIMSDTLSTLLKMSQPLSSLAPIQTMNVPELPPMSTEMVVPQPSMIIPELPPMGTEMVVPQSSQPPQALPQPVASEIKVAPPPRVELGRVRAGMVALALGDALGAPHEFKTQPYTGKLEYKLKHKTNAFQPMKIFDEGSITDDTEMTLALARSLIANQGYDRKKVAEAYIKWANSGTPMMGTNTRALFKVNPITKVDLGGFKHYEKAFEKKFNLYTEWPFAATTEAAEQAQSNGALMRCFPLACCWDESAVTRDVWASNPSTVALDAEGIHVYCLRLALMGTPAKDIWSAIQQLPRTPEVKNVFTAITSGEQWTLANEGKEKKKGWVVNSFYAAMSCLAALASDTPPTFPVLMQWVIEGHPGSDTDTNASIAGGLIGAIIGWDALIADPQTVANITIMLAAGDARKPRTDEHEVYRPDEYRLTDIENIVQGLTALSGVDPSPPKTPSSKTPIPQRKRGKGK